MSSVPNTHSFYTHSMTDGILLNANLQAEPDPDVKKTTKEYLQQGTSGEQKDGCASFSRVRPCISADSCLGKI